ncbi:hypothetical protein M199_gp145 [Halogranum tailed virus 1]|uniref:Uncharacterized protein n=1 Tax=Halogranum tailed virus 1 TaxID=1273749 RepID=R4TGW8_9CAUD|nr:hypothetical protein M199_gp145 [Halogranum tailed virus 1]AGM11521.1 hypothetical protein HGTV1_224 [Halogranum tailed virus 1]
MTKIEIEVSDDDVALEVAYGILGRAQDIHDNPDDEFEEVALELRDVGQNLAAEYGDSFK